MKKNKTLILGASSKPERAAYQAAERLHKAGFPFYAIGWKAGQTGGGASIDTELQSFENLHTVTLYLSPKNQEEYYEYIASLKPQRVIFNPGTENPELAAYLKKLDTPPHIDWACTLVMLSLGSYGEAFS